MKTCVKIAASTLALSITIPAAFTPALAMPSEDEYYSELMEEKAALFSQLDAYLLALGPGDAPFDPGYTEAHKKLWSLLEDIGTPADISSFMAYPKPPTVPEQPSVEPIRDENGNIVPAPILPEPGSYAPGQPVDGEGGTFSFNKYVEAYYGAQPGQTARITFGAGNKRIDLPQAGYGTRITDDGERYALLTDDTLDGETYNLTLGARDVFRPGIPDGDLGFLGRKFYGAGSETFFAFNYSKADGSSDVSIPVGGDPVAITYHDFSDTDSTGLYLGSLGLDVRSETELDEVEIILGRRVIRNFGPNSFWGCLHALSYGYTDVDHTAYISTPTYPDIFSESRQGTSEHLFAGEAGLFAGTRVGRLSFFVEGTFIAAYREAELESWQGTTCGACGTGQQYVDINVNDSDSGLTWGSRLEASADLELAPGWTAGMKYGVHYIDDSASILNPENGDSLFVFDEPTHLGADHLSDQVLIFTVGRTW